MWTEPPPTWNKFVPSSATRAVLAVEEVDAVYHVGQRGISDLAKAGLEGSLQAHFSSPRTSKDDVTAFSRIALDFGSLDGAKRGGTILRTQNATLLDKDPNAGNRTVLRSPGLPSATVWAWSFELSQGPTTVNRSEVAFVVGRFVAHVLVYGKGSTAAAAIDISQSTQTVLESAS